MFKAERKFFISVIVLFFLIPAVYAFDKTNILRIKNQEVILDEPKIPDINRASVSIYKPEKCYNGYTLFLHLRIALPGTVPTSPIYLIDMEGNIIYQWIAENAGHAQLKPDGNLLYGTLVPLLHIFGMIPSQANPQSIIKPTLQKPRSPQSLGHGLYELDFKSNVVWYYPAFIDHDFQILEDGNLLIAEAEPIKEPLITNNREIRGPRYSPILKIITRNGKLLWKWRGEEHINELKMGLGLKFNLITDWTHNNTCSMLGENPLSGKDPRFQKRNIIFSYCALDTIGIIDYQTGKIVWAWGPGEIGGQHTPRLLNNGNILIFDNGGLKREWSRVIELNPLTRKIVWEYHSEPKKDFYSEALSSAFRLPNGNTLICEASKNRIFEVTPDGEIVWDFISTLNKMTGGNQIYRAYRYSPEYVKPLLEKIKEWRDSQNLKPVK